MLWQSWGWGSAESGASPHITNGVWGRGQEGGPGCLCWGRSRGLGWDSECRSASQWTQLGKVGKLRQGTDTFGGGHSRWVGWQSP